MYLTRLSKVQLDDVVDVVQHIQALHAHTTVRIDGISACFFKGSSNDMEVVLAKLYD